MDLLALSAKLTLNKTDYEKGLAGAEKGAIGFGSTLKGILGAEIIKKGFATITGGFKSVATAGLSFDSSMSQVAATMGLTMDSMDVQQLRTFAQEMGSKTKFTATQSADALNYMALAGYDVQTSMKMLPTVLNLAAAGNMDLARASDMVTDTQTAFGLSLDRTGQMVDEMAKAASTGNTSVEQLGDAFLVVGALAKQLNGGMVLLEDGTTKSTDGVQELEIALTAMANAGIKGSEAGTHMRNMLLNLSSPTKDGIKTLNALGVQVFDNEGKMKALSSIFDELNVAMKDLTQEEKIKAMTDLFNARDVASAEALLSAMASDWDSIGESILDAKGAADQMAETQLDNLAGSITLFESALEGVKIAISDMVAPALKSFVDVASGQLQGLKTAMDEGGVRGALTFLEAGFDGLLIKADNVFPGIVNLWLTLQDIFGAVVDFISTKSGDFEEIFETIKGLFSAFVELVSAIWENFGSDIMGYVSAVWNYIKNYIKLALDFIKNIIKLVTSVIKGDWKGAWEAIKNIFQNLWEQIKNVVTFTLETIKAKISVVWKVVSNLTTSAWEGIKNAIKNVWNSIKTAVSDSLEAVKTKVSNVWNSIKSTVSSVVNGIKTTISNGFNSAKTTVSNIFDSIKNSIKNKLESAKNTVKNLIDKIRGFFKFDWSLPKLKMPHLSITGSFNLMPPSTPKFSIEWYKKAYNHAYLFDKPTVGVGLGFGDGVGGEMVVGEGYLMTKIGDAMDSRMGNMAKVVENMYEFMRIYFPMFANLEFNVDGVKFANAVAIPMDEALGRISQRRSRG